MAKQLRTALLPGDGLPVEACSCWSFIVRLSQERTLPYITSGGRAEKVPVL